MALSTGNCGRFTPILGGWAYCPSTSSGSEIQGLSKNDARPILLKSKPFEVFIIERIGIESASALLAIIFFTSAVIALLADFESIPDGHPWEVGGDALDNGLHCILLIFVADVMA